MGSALTYYNGNYTTKKMQLSLVSLSYVCLAYSLVKGILTDNSEVLTEKHFGFSVAIYKISSYSHNIYYVKYKPYKLYRGLYPAVLHI